MKAMLYLKTIAAAVIFSSTASGVSINFEDRPADNMNGALPAERYASLGIHFIATDDGTTWGGLDNGDPGNWGLRGTSGSIFSGFNGGSYGLQATFDAPVSGFTMDVSRANGSFAGNQFTLTGFLKGVQVESQTIVLGAINDWSTISLSSAVDQLAWGGVGAGFHPFGVDFLRWEAATVSVPDSGVGAFGLAAVSTALIFLRSRRQLQE